jgi:hypothetical protein
LITKHLLVPCSQFLYLTLLVIRFHLETLDSMNWGWIENLVNQWGYIENSVNQPGLNRKPCQSIEAT